jgi:predicted GNAT family acetyltransferase
MLIEQKVIGHKGKFYITENDETLAEMVFTVSRGKMIIDHTEVSDWLRGKNIGAQLVHTGVEYARTNNLKIVPLCSFANSVFKKKAEYADVLFTP